MRRTHYNATRYQPRKSGKNVNVKLIIIGSNGRHTYLESKGEKHSNAEKCKRYQIIPRELLFQKCDREDHKDDECHGLLYDLELKA